MDGDTTSRSDGCPSPPPRSPGWLPPPHPPAQPEPSAFDFGEIPGGAGDLIALGGDLAPGTLLAAYTRGLFPMNVEGARGGSRRRQLGWWSPDPRGVIPLDGLRVSRSLRRALRRVAVTSDRAFVEVMEACADPSRPHGWISSSFLDAYTELHRLGWGHSIECWDEDGALVGGLYGVAIGGLFAGESMFYRTRDASKVALVHLVDRLRRGGGTLLDVQWATPHLLSLGAVAIPRAEYLTRAAVAATEPQMRAFATDIDIS